MTRYRLQSIKTKKNQEVIRDIAAINAVLTETNYVRTQIITRNHIVSVICQGALMHVERRGVSQDSLLTSIPIQLHHLNHLNEFFD